MSTHARQLATWLADADDSELERLFEARGVRPDAAWNDFFDAADALLDPASVERAVRALTADDARALKAAADTSTPADPRLVSLVLQRDDAMVFPSVAAIVDELPMPDTTSIPLAPSDEDSAALAAESAFTSIAAIADLLMATREAPFALVSTGNLTAGERRRITDAGVNVEHVDVLLELALVAGLARQEGKEMRITRGGESWLTKPPLERWAEVAEAYRDALPSGIRSPDGGWEPIATWHARHPWNPDWPAGSDLLLDQARLLGLVDNEGREPAWARPLGMGAIADVSELRGLLPPEVDKIFLQNDLTAIAPGPLASVLDVRLRGMARRESAAQASTYRFTRESLARAVADGESEESIIAFLSEITLTGIPQPLQYLIAQTAARHGLIRISADAASQITVIESDDAHLLVTLTVDQALRPLGLTQDGDRLITRVGADTTYWTLTDAHYPATRVGADGAALVVHRAVLDSAPPVATPSFDRLISQLRSRQGPDADAAWLTRELEAAVRAKAILKVSVGMPDGTTRDLTLEATGFGGGRLRGRDRGADVERTLPLSSILTIQTVDQATR